MEQIIRGKLDVLQLTKMYSAFHGTWRSIIAFTRDGRILSAIRWNQSTRSHPKYWRSILVVPTQLLLTSGLPINFTVGNLMFVSHLRYSCYMFCPYSLFDDQMVMSDFVHGLWSTHREEKGHIRFRPRPAGIVSDFVHRHVSFRPRSIPYPSGGKRSYASWNKVDLI
jgi:hypothetical protein